MEPDFNKVVSKKIRETEQQPVSWNKHAVWQKLQSQTSTRRHYYPFYYAAAATILLLIYFAVGLIPGEIEPQVTDVKVNSDQQAIEPATPVLPEKDQHDSPGPAVKNRRQNITTRPVAETPDNTLEDINAAPDETINDEAAIQLVLADINIPEEKFRVPKETAVPRQKIRPIVGVIIESDSENIVEAKQKKPLRKLESFSPVPWEDPANALVFVVRK